MLLPALWLALCTCLPAHAQPGIDLQQLQPGPGRSSAITIPELELPPHGTLRWTASANYARQPWTRHIACAPTEMPDQPFCPVGAPLRSRWLLIPHMTQLELGVALSLFERLQLGAVLPAVFTALVDDVERPSAFVNRSGLGDLRLSVDAPIVSGDTSLGVSLLVSLPTGGSETAASQRSWSVRPALIARQRFDALSLSLSLGYRSRERVQVSDLIYDDELELGLGVGYRVLPQLDASAELRARVGVGEGGTSPTRRPAELDAAVGYRIGSLLRVSLGAGTALWPGRLGYGAPNLRVFGGVALELDARGCAFGPEDYDGYQDDDSCRDPDNDRDGVDDEHDQCPNDPEDRDGFEDQDGCPDNDNDADGLLDSVDHCPERSEDRDGFEDDDGCPEPDNDHDGLLDALDNCPLDPEDRDGFEDDDGCPEPGPSPLQVSIVEQRILVSERIYFDDDRDTIREVSRPVLDQVAAVIRGLRPELKVIVEGHTDEAGTPAYNLDLSHRRARAVVEYLRGRGVAPERLDYIGYGATRPLGPNDSPEGRALNRRVEFTIEH